MRWWWALLVVGLAACSSGAGQPPAERALPESMAVSSPAFAAGGVMPRRFTCAGEDVSPPLAWSGVPAGTVEVAVVVDDPDAPGGIFVQWVVAGIDPAATGLAAGALPPGARQGRNSAGRAAWSGPCPPAGSSHHYRFTVYALTRRADVGGAGAQAAVRRSRRPPAPGGG